MTSYSALSFLKTKSKGDAKRRLEKKLKAKSQKLKAIYFSEPIHE
jgi:hypothetical protein